MNKRNTIKLTSIALVASMAVGLTATAVAGPGTDNKGPKASIKVAAWCDVDNADPSNAILNVHTLVTDNGGPVIAVLKVEENSILPMEGVGNNRNREKFNPLPAGTVENVPSQIGDVQDTPINLCAAGLSSAANAANATVTVEIEGGHKTFTAMCGNHDLDGDGYLDVFSDVKIGHLGLCP